MEPSEPLQACNGTALPLLFRNCVRYDIFLAHVSAILLAVLKALWLTVRHQLRACKLDQTKYFAGLTGLSNLKQLQEMLVDIDCYCSWQ